MVEIMARAFSLDLRQRVMQAYESGMGSQREIAATFGVSHSFVEKLVQRVRQTGSVAARQQGGGPPPRITSEVMDHLRHLVQLQPDISLAELVAHLAQDCDVHVGHSAVCRALKKLGLARKKSAYTPANATRPRYVRRGKITVRRSPHSTPAV
jgi:transposase